MMTIPSELFNASDVPSIGTSDVRVSDYRKTVMYKLPVCTDVMAERAIWNTVCDLASRCGALRKKKSVTFGAGTHDIVLTASDLDACAFQRFVGAGTGVNTTSMTPISLSKLTFSLASTGYPRVVFDTSYNCGYVTYSVSPDVNAQHNTTASNGAYPNDKWVAPKWFFDLYGNLVLNGALYRLHGMNGRPWSDLNKARANALAYNAGINRITHGLITSGMRKFALVGEESAFISKAQDARAAVE